MEKVFISSVMTGCIIWALVSNLMMLIMVVIMVIKDNQGGQKWGLRSSPRSSHSSPKRSRRSAPSSLAVVVKARPTVRSIGVQVELKKVVVRMIKFSDWFERYNERRFSKGHFTWTLWGPGRRRGGCRVQRAFPGLRAAPAGWCNQWAAYRPDGTGPDRATEGAA